MAPGGPHRKQSTHMAKANKQPTEALHFENQNGERVLTLNGMYQDYFLDYASYVILERAVPAVEDGLKPVQRRVLFSMYQMDDGRYHKVANIIGHTMQYHPHGDAAIGDALVNLGQKGLLIDTQGNWGDPRTGDSAAAPRYIEARLTPFAKEVVFNPQTTRWQLSYDGRKKEPVTLPVKFPLLLAQGAEGIAVGLSTRILPHNFVELCKAAIRYLEGKSFKLYPDFDTGGLIDVSDYNDGERGGRVKVRARIEKVDKNTLAIRDLPYGVTTDALIDSIIKANDKGKIKIKKVVDNTAAEVEVLIELASGVSPDVTIDALYAFTHCEVSISPNACVIIDDKPVFTNVSTLLRHAVDHTRNLLQQELEIRQHELLEKWHFASLEKVFIENRIYHEIEECESWEEVLEVIPRELKKYVATPSDKPKASDKRLRLQRDITEDDIVRLTEIRIKRISKYNSFKADELLRQLEQELEEVRHNLAHLTEYTIKWYEHLLTKYGKGRERRTQITSFEAIEAAQVAANNVKLYADFKEGFIGYGLKKGEGEFICECSDLDDIIVFRKDGKMIVTRNAEKTFVGKGIIHVGVWKRGDDRTTYHLLYVDGASGRTYAKRFQVTAITRDREYDLTTGAKGSKVHYFSAHPNGESEVVTIHLTQGCRARKKVFDFDFGELAIKGRGARGNMVTKFPVRKVVQKEVGQSTLGAIEVWMDEVSGRLNTEERGIYLGAFDTGDQILAIYKNGTYEITDFDLLNHYDAPSLVWIGKFDPEAVVSAVYYDGERKRTLVKRFRIEATRTGERYPFITEHRSSTLYYATTAPQPVVEVKYRDGKKTKSEQVDLADFIDVKGWKALGNKLHDGKLTSVKAVDADGKDADDAKAEPDTPPEKLKPGATIEFEVDGGKQGKLF